LSAEASAKADARGTTITVARGADYLRSPVEQVDAATGRVTCLLKPSLGDMPGLNRDFTASNDARTKFWRADFVSDKELHLKGAPVTAADFAPENAIRLWEYGVGDQARQSAFVVVRRLEPGRYEVRANSDVALVLPGGKAVAITARQLAENGGSVVVAAH